MPDSLEAYLDEDTIPAHKTARAVREEYFVWIEGRGEKLWCLAGIYYTKKTHFEMGTTAHLKNNGKLTSWFCNYCERITVVIVLQNGFV